MNEINETIMLMEDDEDEVASGMPSPFQFPGMMPSTESTRSSIINLPRAGGDCYSIQVHSVMDMTTGNTETTIDVVGLEDPTPDETRALATIVAGLFTS